MSRFLKRGAHLCASGFSSSAAHVSFKTCRSVCAAHFLFANLILIVGLVSLQPAHAVDYVVNGPNTSTNGDLNISPITGVGDTLTITNGSSITATNAEGIHFDTAGQNTIVNLGSISTTGNFAHGIFNQDSADSTINNSGSINTGSANAHGIFNLSSAGNTINSSGSISTIGSYAYGIFNQNSADNTINNSGSINTIGSDAYGVYSQNSADIMISNSGSINTTGSNAHGVLNILSTGGTISNNGSIITTNGNAYGIYNYYSEESAISNSGSINTAGSSAHGIYNENSADTPINNSGSINTQGLAAHGVVNIMSTDSAINNSGSISTTGQDAYGIHNLNSAGSMISNSGSISTTNGRAAGIFNLSSVGSTISNSGSISTEHFDAFGILNQNSANTTISNIGSIRTIGAASHGIYNEASTGSTIRNSGSIRVDDSNAIGIRSDRAVTLINSGLVFAASTASSAIELNTGNDILTLSAGSRIQGLIGMNNGDDTITLDHGGNDIAWRWTFENFKDASPDVLSVIGAPYVVEDAGLSGGGSGITVTVADVSRETNAGAVLADLTGAVTGAVTGRIAEAWALADAGLSTGADMTDENGNALGWNAWAKAFGGLQDRGSLAEFGGLSTDTRHSFGGMIVGTDTAPSDDVLFGAFGGFALSRLSFADASLNDTGASDIDTNTLFGGIYGRIASAHSQNGGSLFADGTLTIGYADGDADTRLQANNLVTGGIEEITGGDASGAYIATSATFGAHVPVGTTSAVLIPSATLGYAAQWRKGYSEDMSVDGAMSVEDYVAAVLTARLQLATQISRSTNSDMAWTAAFRGGIDLQKDVSQDVELTMLDTALSADAGPDELQLGGFLGANLAMMLSDTFALTIDGELTFSGHNADALGGTLNAGIRARF